MKSTFDASEHSSTNFYFKPKLHKLQLTGGCSRKRVPPDKVFHCSKDMTGEKLDYDAPTKTPEEGNMLKQLSQKQLPRP